MKGFFRDLNDSIVDHIKKTSLDKKNRTPEERIKVLEKSYAFIKIILALTLILSIALFSWEHYTRNKNEYPYLYGTRVIVIVKLTVDPNKTIQEQMNDFLNKNVSTKRYVSYDEYVRMFKIFNNIDEDESINKKPNRMTLYFPYMAHIGPRD